MSLKDFAQPKDSEGFTVLEQLFQKLTCASSAERSNDNDSKSTSPYIVLIQHSLSRTIRLRRAGIMDDPNMNGPHSSKKKASSSSAAAVSADLYRRAGLATPMETAARDWVAGRLWLEQMILEQQKKQIEQEPTNSRPSARRTTRLIWIQTTPSSLPVVPVSGPSSNEKEYVTIINASLDPWGWDAEESNSDNKRDDSAHPPPANLDSLDSILASVRFDMKKKSGEKDEQEARDSASFIVTFDSLTPLLTRHGFARVLRFLQKLSHMSTATTTNTPAKRLILVIPILTESLTQRQHLQLEDDFAHAVLWLQNGHATFLRRGIRESENLMRHDLPFDVVVQQQHQQRHRSGSASVRLGLAPASIRKSSTEEEEKEVENAKPPTAAAMELNNKQPVAGQEPSQPQQHQGRRPRVQLKLENEEDGAVQSRQQAQQPAATAPQVPQQPRIYLENDDPEFDDYDEEDPDDDLDI